MDFYLDRIPEERKFKKVNSPGTLSEWIDSQINEKRIRQKELSNRREQIIRDFGEKYTDEVDGQIKKCTHDIEALEFDKCVTSKVDDLLVHILHSLGVKFQCGVCCDGYNNFRPFRDKFVYSFSKSGALLLLETWPRSYCLKDHINIKMRYVFTNGEAPVICDFYYCEDGMPQMKDEGDFFKNIYTSSRDKRSNFDEYQIAEFIRAIDIVSSALCDFVNSQKINKEEEK